MNSSYELKEFRCKDYKSEGRMRCWLNESYAKTGYQVVYEETIRALRSDGESLVEETTRRLLKNNQNAWKSVLT